MHRQQLGLTQRKATGAGDDQNTQTASAGPHPASIEWQKVERDKDGFQLDMPDDVKQIQIPAYTETGGTQQLSMIVSNPGTETTFSVAWEDNPPVARVNRQAVDRTLEMARDGAIARTHTALLNETRENTQGYPGLSFEARNAGGGILSARLIYAAPRLYMLTATFPSAGARRERDVSRFFNSFTITAPSGSSSEGSGNVN